MIALTGLAWFMVLILSERMPPLLLDMPSQATCNQVLELNPEYRGAHCWAKEKLGESVDVPPGMPSIMPYAAKPKPDVSEDDPL